MKRVFLGVLVLATTFALSAWSTETRVTTLGDANNVVKDEAGIFIYPALILDFSDLVLGEIGQVSIGGGLVETQLYRLGAHIDLGNQIGVLGLYLDRKPYSLDGVNYRPNINGNGIDHRIGLFYGRPFGDIDFGLGFILYRDSYSAEQFLSSDTTIVYDYSEDTQLQNTNWKLLLGSSLMEKRLDIGVSIEKDSWKYTDVAGEDITKPNGSTSFVLASRYWFARSESMNLIPHFTLKLTSVGYDSIFRVLTNDGEMRYKSKTTDLDLGIGLNLRPRDNILLIGDLGVDFISWSEEVKISITGSSDNYNWNRPSSYLPYFRMGLEAKLCKWCDIRLGAVRRWVRSTIEFPSDYQWPAQDRTERYGYATTTTYVGSGIHLGDLSLDLWMDPDLLLHGPYLVSGATSNFLYMMSVKYSWK